VITVRTQDLIARGKTMSVKPSVGDGAASSTLVGQLLTNDCPSEIASIVLDVV